MQDYIVEPTLNLPHLTEQHRLFNALPVIMVSDRDRRISSVHWHDYLQIFYTMSGSYRHVLDGVAHVQTPGCIVLNFPYMPHQIDTSASDLSELNIFQISIRKDMWRKYCVPFLPHSYDSASFDSFRLRPLMTVTGRNREVLDQICADLISEYNKQMNMQANRLLSLVGDFLAVLVKDSDRAISARGRNTICARNDSIDRVIDLMKSNTVKGLPLETICKYAGMSRSGFSASFRCVTGKTYSSYQGLLRMLNAVDALRTTQKSIAQIAREWGYYDSSHFRLKCVEICGMPPHTLRAAMREFTRADSERYLRSIEQMRWTQSFDEYTMQKHKSALTVY